MDIISHALWSALIFIHINPWLAALAGILPDVLAFFPLTTYQIIKKEPFSAHHFGDLHNRYHTYPQWLRTYAETTYSATHSLIVCTVVISVCFLLFGPVYWILAWPMHVLMDVPLHKKSFFGTRIFWPFHNWAYDGVYWSNNYVLIANALALLAVGLLVLV